MSQAATFKHQGAQLRAEPLTDAILPLRVVYIHGWEHTRESLRPLANSLVELGETWLLDLPGFGENLPPPEGFTPQQYAAVVEGWLRTLPPLPTVLIGHGFGFHVALHLARGRQDAKYPPEIKAMVGIAGTGLPEALPPDQQPPQLTLWQRLTGTRPAPRIPRSAYYYLAAGEAMRATHMAATADDVAPLCTDLGQPTLLMYAAEDLRTPLAAGKRFLKLLPHATLHVLERQGHAALLQTSRHTVAQHIRDFVEKLG